IEHVIAAARPVANRMGIIINTKNPKLELYRELSQTWEVELIPDLHDHCGPLGGIFTALNHCRDQVSSALMLACDLPFITSEILLLLSHIHNEELNELTMPVDQFGRAQPLAAIYACNCLPVVERLLAENLLRVNGIYPSVRLRRVSFEEFAQLPGAENFFLNINTPEDHLRYL